MIRCSCCRADIVEPIVRTRTGEFVSPWGLCRSCWRRVPGPLRTVFRRARLEYRAMPMLANALKVYRIWLDVETAAAESPGRRAA